MVPPLLKLEFTQGPRAGDSLGFKPGSTIRIGRVVRGNEIAIKDAGISTKHLRIVSDSSENWIIQDLGSSNGTILNSESIDPDTPVNLSHGDEIKLGEYTSIVVNFVSDVQPPPPPQEPKLPPRPRRNNKRNAVSDPDPDPIESVQEKPKRARGSLKQEDNELPKKTRASRKKNLADIVDKEEELEVEVEKKVNSRVGRPWKNAKEEVPEEKEVNPRVGRPRKNASSAKEEVSEEKKVNRRVGRPRKNAITNEEQVPEEEKGNSGVRKGSNSESIEKLGLKSIKLEVEDTPKRVEISEVESRKRVTRSKQVENVKTEDTVLEVNDEKRATRATRSKKTEIGGDSFLELEMVLSLARKSRAKRRKMEQEPSKSVVEMETRNDDAGEEVLKNCHVEEDKEYEAQGGCSERSDDKCDKEDEREGDGSKRVEQVETELRKNSTVIEDDLNCTIREDGEIENLQDIEEENGNKAQEGCSERSDDKCVKEDEREGDGSKRVEQVESELRKKSTVGEDHLNCTVREDGETKNLQDIVEENGNKSQEGCSERSDDKCDKEDEREGDGSKRVEKVESELRKKSTVGEDDLNCTVREDGETENLQDVVEENGNKSQEGCSERSDEKREKEDEREGDGSKRVEQVEIELRKKNTIEEDDLNCTVREVADTENLQQIEEERCDEERECTVEEAGIATVDDDCEEEKVEQVSSNRIVERVGVDLGKMTLRNWFDSMEAQLPKQTIEETEKMIEPMRSKTLRVYNHIVEQREKGV
ncbi:PREDICTED: ABC transporter F family member 4-like [Camelina sativa]|uniref:ABC transporter F family member 4-like n=1 Tax=Camelina sativa TaxID=90675 RepID=A0ABM0XG24_CAMSA|nr:PREDICTED: ABC transporter F family member 4-like [Camelina sativa]